ncbi:MAG: glycolate oxidase subunit GlcE [Burkholderiaceae bacterium]|nr:glycolate oxidase subunit GlcE [Burkholderiaceae bacterium]
MSPPTPHDPDWLRQSADMIREAGASGRALRIRGQGSKDFYGMPADDSAQILTTLPHTGVVDYDPAELVVVARCGTPITELEAVLAKSRQMLAFEPPRFSGRGTVGGMMASGLSGPRRMSAGAAKDFVLGMTVLDAQAEPTRFGGTVMKNVAGYDISRLHTGALGTLGLMVDVSLKVLPMPPADATLVFSVSAEQSIEWANAWGGQPLPIAATSWRDGQLAVRLSGAAAAIRAAKEKLGGDVMPQPEAQAYWQRLRDHEDGFFALDAAVADVNLWRLSVPSITPHLSEIVEPQWLEWGGALRWVKTNAPGQRLRAIAAQHGGHATLFRSARAETRQKEGVFSELSPALMKIHHRLKQELDPNRIFNPGRMFAGL